MFCNNCGANIPDNAQFCQSCGSPAAKRQDGEVWRSSATAEENNLLQGRRVSPNIYLGDDGKYRWVYELNLKKDVTMRRYVFKFFTYILLIFLLPGLLGFLFTGSEIAGGFCLVILGCAAFIYACTFIGMALYSLIYKGSYWSIFEMDDRKITQKQMQQTVDRTQILSLLIVLGSRDAGTVSYVAGGGIATRYECPFKSITAVKLDRPHDLIDCSRVMGFCPLYVGPEDYNFVVDHIVNHVSEKTATKFRAKYH